MKLYQIKYNSKTSTRADRQNASVVQTLFDLLVVLDHTVLATSCSPSFSLQSSTPTPGLSASAKVDVYSAGLLLLEAFLGFQVWSYLNLQQIFFKIMSFVNHGQHPLDVILRDHSAESKFNALPEGKFV